MDNNRFPLRFCSNVLRRHCELLSETMKHSLACNATKKVALIITASTLQARAKKKDFNVKSAVPLFLEFMFVLNKPEEESIKEESENHHDEGERYGIGKMRELSFARLINVTPGGVGWQPYFLMPDDITHSVDNVF